MRINNIFLENFRIHKSLYIEFTEGINLILGANGSGKSSVIEAIGIAMFGTEPRTNLREVIKNGADFFHIKIEFTGNDNQIYIVEKYGGRKNKYILQQKNNINLYVDSKDEILKIIRGLCGISEDSNKIFTSMITTEQNKIIDIFLGTNKEREKYFNEIFNTKIYREIFEGFAKDVIMSYREKLNILDGKFELINSEIKKFDIDSILENIKIIDRNLKELENNKKEILKVKDELLEYINKQEILDKQLSKNIQYYNQTKELLNVYYDNLKKISEDINQIKKSEKFIKENASKYERYLFLKKEFDRLSIQIDKKNQIKDKIVKLNEDKASIKNMNNILIDQNKNFINNIEIEKEKKESIIHELDELLSNRNEVKNEIEKLTLELDSMEKIINSFEKLYTEYIGYIKNRDILSSHIKTFEDKNIDIEVLNSTLLELKDKLNFINEVENQIKLLEYEKNTIIELIKLNKEAREKLMIGVCPYLNEKCLNLQNKNIDDYFSVREKKLIEQKFDLDNKIDELRKEVIVKQAIEADMDNIKNKIYNFKEENDQYLRNIDNKKIIDDKLKNIKSKIANLLNLEDISVINIDDLKVDIFAKKDRFRNNIENKQEELVKLDRNIKNREQEKESVFLRMSKLQKSIDDNKYKVIKNKEDIERLSADIQLLEDQIKDLSSLINSKNDIDKELKELEAFYKEYISNLARLDKSSRKIKEKNKLLEQIANKEDELSILSKKIEELKSEFSAEDLQKKKEEKEKFDSKLIELEKKISGQDKELFFYISEKDRYEKLLSDLDKYRKEKNLVENKINLAETFRKNLDTMGKSVANIFLKNIERKATENFQKITGRDEIIRWINNIGETNDSYKVYLYDWAEDFYIDFAILSGGEQVAVALSLRFALASFFSNANFSIFDEPTNNLDMERRKSLADNLGIILDNHQQSIVITHDDTFKEMAQNIIILK